MLFHMTKLKISTSSAAYLLNIFYAQSDLLVLFAYFSLLANSSYALDHSVGSQLIHLASHTAKALRNKSRKYNKTSEDLSS